MVALPFGVLDTTVYMVTLGNVKMNASNEVRSAVNHVTGADERIAQRREALNARLEAARMKAEQDEEFKRELAVYRHIAEIKDRDNLLKCENTACNRYDNYDIVISCEYRCATLHANTTDEEFRKYKAEMEKESQK